MGSCFSRPQKVDHTPGVHIKILNNISQDPNRPTLMKKYTLDKIRSPLSRLIQFYDPDIVVCIRRLIRIKNPKYYQLCACSHTQSQCEHCFGNMPHVPTEPATRHIITMKELKTHSAKALGFFDDDN